MYYTYYEGVLNVFPFKQGCYVSEDFVYLIYHILYIFTSEHINFVISRLLYGCLFKQSVCLYNDTHRYNLQENSLRLFTCYCWPVLFKLIYLSMQKKNRKFETSIKLKQIFTKPPIVYYLQTNTKKALFP